MDAAVAAVPPHLRLCRPGYLPFADLPGFLGGALVVAFPSHGEGFGLPVLEAMACGAPVLTTHRTSLPEVGGEAVAYTEPDAESIQVALRALIDDPERRAALGVLGHAGPRSSPGPRRRPRIWPATSARRTSRRRTPAPGELSCGEFWRVTRQARIPGRRGASRAREYAA